MKQLQAYGLAIAGSILAVLVTPGNLVGVPVGIWALVVLSQRQVRQAFGKGHTVAHFEAARPANGGKAWKVAAVIMAAVMLLIAIPVGAIMLAMLLPAVSRARAQAALVQGRINQRAPTFVVRGTVTDAVTGQPIERARVDDNSYGAGHNRPPQQAWTDAQGHYELHTWYEEHTLGASAAGYQTKLQTLFTANFQQEKSAQIDFQLQPAESPSAKP